MSIITILMAFVVGAISYLLAKTIVGLVKPFSQFAEAFGIIVGCLVTLFLLGFLG